MSSVTNNISYDGPQQNQTVLTQLSQIGNVTQIDEDHKLDESQVDNELIFSKGKDRRK